MSGEYEGTQPVRGRKGGSLPVQRCAMDWSLLLLFFVFVVVVAAAAVVGWFVVVVVVVVVVCLFV